MKNFFKYWLPPIVWVIIIFILSSIPDLKVEEFKSWDLILRKLAHMAEYSILAIFLIRLGLRNNNKNIIIYILSILGCALYALTDEWHQTYVPGRYGSIIDVLIDTGGGTIGALVYYFLKK